MNINFLDFFFSFFIMEKQKCRFFFHIYILNIKEIEKMAIHVVGYNGQWMSSLEKNIKLLEYSKAD